MKERWASIKEEVGIDEGFSFIEEGGGWDR
jgi:hypothetical protein